MVQPLPRASYTSLKGGKKANTTAFCFYPFVYNPAICSFGKMQKENAPKPILADRFCRRKHSASFPAHFAHAAPPLRVRSLLPRTPFWRGFALHPLSIPQGAPPNPLFGTPRLSHATHPRPDVHLPLWGGCAPGGAPRGRGPPRLPHRGPCGHEAPVWPRGICWDLDGPTHI